MSDDWNRFVRVIRADGSERTLPLAAWTEDLERRVLEAGGRVVMVDEDAPQEAAPPAPREPAADFAPAPAPARARAPVATMPRRGAGQRDEDLATIQQLTANADALTPWESEFSTSIARWLESHDTLTEKQRAKAKQILSELD